MKISVPSGLSTRRISRSAAIGSAMEHNDHVTTTVSMTASANGIVSARCSTRSTGKSAPATFDLAIASSSSEGSIPISLVTAFE
jgi:hypothetical protein